MVCQDDNELDYRNGIIMYNILLANVVNHRNKLFSRLFSYGVPTNACTSTIINE